MSVLKFPGWIIMLAIIIQFSVYGNPLLYVFLGSDWCPWSSKLKTEILSNDHFLNPVKEEFEIRYLDFPEHFSTLDDPKIKEMVALKEKYKVAEFPTFLLVDDKNEEIVKEGYLPLQPEEYAQHLKHIITSYREIRNVNYKKLNSAQLEKLYTQAQSCGFNQIKENILQQGLKVGRGPFFHLEKYAHLIQCGKKRKDRELLGVRREIMKRDPNNKQKGQYQLALLDFQLLSHSLKTKEDPQVAVSPLIDYLKKYGKKEKQDVWKVEMMIAQYLFSKNLLPQALEHIEASYTSAPDDVKAQIASARDYLKSKSAGQ